MSANLEAEAKLCYRVSAHRVEEGKSEAHLRSASDNAVMAGGAASYYALSPAAGASADSPSLAMEAKHQEPDAPAAAASSSAAASASSVMMVVDQEEPVQDARTATLQPLSAHSLAAEPRVVLKYTTDADGTNQPRYLSLFIHWDNSL